MWGANEMVARSPMQLRSPAVVVACPSRPLSSSVMRPSSSRTRILMPFTVICAHQRSSGTELQVDLQLMPCGVILASADDVRLVISTHFSTLGL